MRRYLGEAVCAAVRLAGLPLGLNPVWAGIKRGPQSRSVALTFDDGPSEATPYLLDVLGKHGVSATFFQVGRNVLRLPELARQVHESGHEIGNHTFTHKMLYGQPQEVIRFEIARTQQAIQEVSGAVPLWFRAPFGSRWFGVQRAVQQAGLRLVKWSQDSGDWHADETAIVANGAAVRHGGAIILFHDGRALTTNPDLAQTIRAVDSVIPVLFDQGYTLERLSPLLGPES